MELFAGEAWVSRSFRHQGYATASLDVLMGHPREGKLDAMDLRTSAGMAFLAKSIVAQNYPNIKNYWGTFGLDFSRGPCLLPWFLWYSA